MADKLRKTAPLSVTYSDGEQPTASKLTAMALQIRNGLAIIEQVVGDVWNQNGDTWMTDYPLQIPNLARMIGPSNYSNPAIYPFDTTFKFYESIGEKFENKNVGYLLYIPEASSFTQETGSSFSSEVSNEYDVNTTGEYWIDYTTGRFRVFGELASNEKVSYNVNPSSTWHVGQETLPGVIPDPRQAVWTGLRVTKSGDKFFLHLPPRTPLTLATKEVPHRYPSTTEQADSLNFGTSGTANYRWWHRTTSTALTGAGSEHYRYRLPKEILDQYAAAADGTEYPQGLMWLWDINNNTLIENVRFFKSSVAGELDYVIEVTSTTFDFDTYATADGGTGTTTDYDTGLALITCGAPLSRSVWTLMSAFLRHGHGHTGSMDPPVSHNVLEDTNPPVNAYDDHTGRYPTYMPSWSPSYWANDSHVSLLNRAGAQGGSNERDINDNAMLGHLVLANTVATAGIFVDSTTPDDSFRLYFGDVGGSNIYQDSNQDMVFENSSGYLFFNQSGYLGIGITPTAKLHINEGDILVTRTDNGQMLFENDGTSIEYSKIQFDKTSEQGNLSSGAISGQFFFRGYMDAGFKDMASITVSAGTGWASSSYATSIDFQTVKTSGTSLASRFLIGSDGNLTFGTGSLLYMDRGTEALPVLAPSADTDTGIYFPSDAEKGVAFSASGSEVLRIANDGEVGIGIAVPAAPLHLTDDASTPSDVHTFTKLLVSSLSGNAAIQVSSGDTDTASIYFGKNLAAVSGALIYQNDSSNPYMRFYVGASERARLIGDNFGIGEGSPDSLLHITSTALTSIDPIADTLVTLENNGNAYVSFLTSTSGIAGLSFSDTNASAQGAIFFKQSTQSLNFYTGNNTTNEKWNIDSNGVLIAGSTSASGTIEANDGAVDAPSFSFRTESTSGFYLATANDVRLTIGGVDRWKTDTSEFNVSALQTIISQGTEGSPGIAFSGTKTYGLYYDTNISFSVAGTKVASMDSGGLNVDGTIELGTGQTSADYTLADAETYTVMVSPYSLAADSDIEDNNGYQEVTPATTDPLRIPINGLRVGHTITEVLVHIVPSSVINYTVSLYKRAWGESESVVSVASVTESSSGNPIIDISTLSNEVVDSNTHYWIHVAPSSAVTTEFYGAKITMSGSDLRLGATA